MRLPAIMPEQHALDEGEVHAPATTADGKHIVLVVDDDPAQRELLTRFLQREGFAVRTAADGRAGLEMARSIRPRAILLDVMMPQMDGWSVLRALKADPELAAIPVVMASFVHEPGLASVLGAADYRRQARRVGPAQGGDAAFPGGRGDRCWWWTTTPTPAPASARCWNATIGW